MGSEGGREADPVEARLFEEPETFGFFQAVRLLERLFEERARAEPAWSRSPVGGDESPRREVVRFRAATSLSFPGRSVTRLRLSAGAGQKPSPDQPPPEMTVNFLGLGGPAGVLPYHYTELLMRRVRARDFALRDFLDLFNHRAVSFFYRAWEKYRFPAGYERAAARSDGDLFTSCVRALVGAGTPGLRGRLQFPDDACLAFAGHFAAGTRPAVSLETMLREYFELPVDLIQFHGDWIRLGYDERTVLPTEANPRGRFARLGHDFIVGSRAFEVATRFRLRVGPIPYSQFRELMPTGTLLRPFCEFVRRHVGAEYAFDVQPVLLANQAPPCVLGVTVPDAPRLGWNTWLRRDPVDREFDGVSFSVETLDLRVIKRQSGR